jgi:hypothetical protein
VVVRPHRLGTSVPARADDGAVKSDYRPSTVRGTLTRPAAVPRALEGLAAYSGRTIALAGPPTSGKSARIKELAEELERREVVVLTSEGSYRDRDADYGALTALWEQYTAKVPSETEEPPTDVRGAFANLVPSAGITSRGGRRRSRSSGRPVGPRPVSGGFESATAVWTTFTERFRRGEAVRLAILVRNATLLDPASRTLLLELSHLARRRPFLLVLELDTSLPSFSQWEEELLGRPDVDWIRLPHPRADARETARLQEILESLPEATRRLVGLVAMLDGSTSSVVLARIARYRTSELTELLQPALGANLLRVDGARISIAHEAWVGHLIESLPDTERRDMHRVVAQGLEALSPEPNLQRRFEIAEHYFQAEPGPTALRYLVEAAHLAERVQAFDQAESVLAQAISCIPSPPPPVLAEQEIELRFDRARLLALGGRPREVEAAIREAVDATLHHRLPDGRLEELLLALAQVVFVLGPRPTLRQVLAEASDRLRRAKWPGPEAVAHTLVAFLDMLAGRADEARAEIGRAHALSAGPGTGLAEVAGQLYDALVELWDTELLLPSATRALDTARRLLRGSHLAELDLLCTDIEARYAAILDGPDVGLRTVDHGLLVAERIGASWLELDLLHQRMEVLLASGAVEPLREALRRCEHLGETLHLIPPCPALFRQWGFAARLAQIQGRGDDAREQWLDSLAQAGYAGLPRIRARALVRLARLSASQKDFGAARSRLDQLNAEGLASQLPPRLVRELRSLSEEMAAAPD